MKHNLTSRRDFLSAGLTAVSAASLGQLTQGANTAPPPFKPGKAKSVIQVWMWGGPSHLETFDPKPAAGRDYCGSWDTPLTTNVPNVEIRSIVADAGGVCGYVFNYPLDDTRFKPSRNRRLYDADRKNARRRIGLPMHRCRHC